GLGLLLRLRNSRGCGVHLALKTAHHDTCANDANRQEHNRNPPDTADSLPMYGNLSISSLAIGQGTLEHLEPFGYVRRCLRQRERRARRQGIPIVVASRRSMIAAVIAVARIAELIMK